MNPLQELAGFFAVYPTKWDEWLPEMLRAIGSTIEITVGSYMLGLVIGLVIALARLSRSSALRQFAAAYIEITRGVPALVVLFLLYFGLAPLGITLSALPAAILGLGLGAGGYIAEILRAGIEATHRGQREAGVASGMMPAAIYRYIVLPQAMRVVLPPLLNMLISILKDSSLASLISAPEIMLRAKDLASTDFLPLHIFLLAGGLYFLMALPLSFLAARIEKRMRRGLGARLT